MKEQLSPKHRRELQSRMIEVFKKNISTLSKEFQQILVDDLVTAFQNRMLVFTRIQRKKGDNNKRKSKKLSLNP
ncbi:MAG: hypothetical protein U9O89_05925 [Thermoproteota archaeon]|nr:hypothetical protein [Thermoproteota archaeon]